MMVTLLKYAAIFLSCSSSYKVDTLNIENDIFSKGFEEPLVLNPILTKCILCTLISFADSFQMKEQSICKILSPNKDTDENYCRRQVAKGINECIDFVYKPFRQEMENSSKSIAYWHQMSILMDNFQETLPKKAANEMVVRIIMDHSTDLSPKSLALLICDAVVDVEESVREGMIRRLEPLGTKLLEILLLQIRNSPFRTKYLLAALLSLPKVFPDLIELFTEQGCLKVGKLKDTFTVFISNALAKNPILLNWLLLILKKNPVDATCVLGEANEKASQFEGRLIASLEHILFKHEKYISLLPDATKQPQLVSAMLKFRKELDLSPTSTYQLFIKGDMNAIEDYIQHALSHHLTSQIVHFDQDSQQEFVNIIPKSNVCQVLQELSEIIDKREIPLAYALFTQLVFKGASNFSSKAMSCLVTELLLPLDKTEREQILQRVRTLPDDVLLSVFHEIKEKEALANKIRSILLLDLLFPNAPQIIQKDGMLNLAKIAACLEEFWRNVPIKPKESLEKLLNAMDDDFTKIEAYSAVYKAYLFNLESFYSKLEQYLLKQSGIGKALAIIHQTFMEKLKKYPQLPSYRYSFNLCVGSTTIEDCLARLDELLVMAEKEYLVESFCSVGDFKALEVIDKRAFSIIYKATHEKSGLDVVLKKLYVLERYQKEMKLMQTITHPYVLSPYCGFEDSKSYYLVLPYVPGGSLREKGGNLTIQEISKFTTQLLDGLLDIHMHRIFHWDIKHDNLLIDKDGNLKIIDFGNSEALRLDQGPSIRIDLQDVASVLYYLATKDTIFAASINLREFRDGIWKIPLTGIQKVDQVIDRLTIAEPGLWWKLVVTEMEQFRKLPLFQGQIWYRSPEFYPEWLRTWNSN